MINCKDPKHPTHCRACDPEAFGASNPDLVFFRKAIVEAVKKATRLLGDGADIPLLIDDPQTFFTSHLGPGAEVISSPFIRGVSQAAKILETMGFPADSRALVVIAVVDELVMLRSQGPLPRETPP